MKKSRIGQLVRIIVFIGLVFSLFGNNIGAVLQVSAGSSLTKPNSLPQAPLNKTMTTGKYDDAASALSYTGSWEIVDSSEAVQGHLHESPKVDDSVTFTMAGTAFALIYTSDPSHGIFDVFVDGSKLTTISETTSKIIYQHEWDSPHVSPGTHEIKLVHASGEYVGVDQIMVSGPTSAQPTATTNSNPTATQKPVIPTANNPAATLNSTAVPAPTSANPTAANTSTPLPTPTVGAPAPTDTITPPPNQLSSNSVSSSSTPSPKPTATRASTSPLPNTYKFDFGTASSPLSSGYTRITETTCYTSGGFGWTSTSGLQSRDRTNLADDLLRDFVMSNAGAGTFKVDLPNGSYSVTVTMGDQNYAHDNMVVKANGTTVLGNVNSAVGGFAVNTFVVSVSSGSLSLEFSDAGGSDPAWIVNALTINPGSVTPTPTFTSAAPTATGSSTPLPSPTSTLPIPTATGSSIPSVSPTPTISLTPSVSPTPGTTTNYYVDVIQGSDSNPGSQSQPWKTLQKAADTVSSGATVNVQPGTYAQVNINKSMTILCTNSVITQVVINADNVTVKNCIAANSSDHGYIVSGYNNVINGGSVHDNAWGGILISGTVANPNMAKNTLIENVTITHNGQNCIEDRGVNSIIRNNDCSNSIQYWPGLSSYPDWLDADCYRFFNSGGLWQGNKCHDINFDAVYNINPHIDCFQTFNDSSSHIAGHDVVFDGNLCNFSMEEQGGGATKGWQVEQGAYNLKMQNNVVHAVIIALISSGSATTHDISFLNNTFVGDPTYGDAVGIYLTGITNSTIKNNIFAYQQNGIGSIWPDAVSKTTLSVGNNCVYIAGRNPWRAADPGDVWGLNPLFVNESTHDYHLQSASPCINKGMNSGVSKDFDGKTRPQGSGYDMGAYEYGP